MWKKMSSSCKSKDFQVFSEPFPWHVRSLFNIPCISSCFWTSLSLTLGSQKGQKIKIKQWRVLAVKVLWKSLHTEGVGLTAMGGGETTMTTYLFVCTSVIKKQKSVTGAQRSAIWRTRSFLLPTLAPTSCARLAPGRCAQFPATGLGMGVG